MAGLSNKSILEMAKEITIAALQSTDKSVNKCTGADTANFFEAVYNKISELNSDET